MARHPIHDVVVVVPGIGGSVLQRRGRPIWGWADVASSLVNPERVLFLEGDGFSVDRNVTAVGPVGRLAQLPGLSAIDAYGRLLDQLHARFEFNASNFVVFAYDWRLSCTVNAQLLTERVDPVLRARQELCPDARLVFICHSMGGLVVQHFTDVLGWGHQTKHVITLGTPFRGAAKALEALTGGWPKSLPFVRQRFRRLARTLPSFFELLPRYKAFIDGASGRRVLRASDLDTDLDKELFARACKFHEALDQPGTRPYRRTVVVGSLQRTPQYVDRRDARLAIHYELNENGTVLDERGDRTVPRQSVAPPEWDDDASAMPYPVTHMGLPVSDSVFRVVYNVLTAKPRAEQIDERARIAVTIPDLVMAPGRVEVMCEVVEGDGAIPLLVRVDLLNGSRVPPRFRSPQLQDGHLIACFDGLPPGDYKVTVAPGADLPDVRRVWDGLTVVDPRLESAGMD